METLEGKVVVLGSQGVGKSSVVIRFAKGKFSTNISSTIGVALFSCKMKIDNTAVRLQIWDTAGQERFQSVIPMYYRDANVILYVFDLTDKRSFESVKMWYKKLQSNVKKPTVLSLVGNKVDLVDKRQVTFEEALQYAKSIGAQYHESSALHDQAIDQVFLNAATEFVKLSGGTNYRRHSGALTWTANSTSLNATDIGKTEKAPWSIENIAHGDPVKHCMCC